MPEKRESCLGAETDKMSLIGCLVVGILVFWAAYLLSKMRLRKRGYEALDIERAVAMATPEAKRRRPEINNMHDAGTSPESLPAWSSTASPSHLDLDQESIDAQLLGELGSAAGATLKEPNALTSTRERLLADAEFGPVLYVNPKQYHRIIKRRIFRQALEESLRIPKTSGSGRRLRRPKAADGVVVALS